MKLRSLRTPEAGAFLVMDQAKAAARASGTTVVDLSVGSSDLLPPTEALQAVQVRDICRRLASSITPYECCCVRCVAAASCMHAFHAHAADSLLDMYITGFGVGLYQWLDGCTTITGSLSVYGVWWAGRGGLAVCSATWQLALGIRTIHVCYAHMVSFTGGSELTFVSCIVGLSG
jgi:hypothetical protein